MQKSKRLAVGFFLSVVLHCSFYFLLESTKNCGGIAALSTATVALVGTLATSPKQNLDTDPEGADFGKKSVKEEERLTVSNNPETNELSLNPTQPIFYRTSELDSPPLLIDDYPEILSIDREETNRGKLVIEVWIDSNGGVLRVVPLESTLPDYVVIEAMSQVGRLRFSPGLKAGVAVFARFRLEFQSQESDLEESVSAGATGSD